MDRLSLIHFLVLALGSITVAQQAQKPNEPPAQADPPLTDEELHLPLDPQTAAEVDRLIPLLNSPTFSERERATEALAAIGARAFAKLRDAYAQTDDLEVRLRIEQTVRSGYLNRHVFDKYGFLGVQLQPVDTAKQRPGKQPPPAATVENALQINRVIADTAASRAGLQAEDIVYSLNGVPVVGGGQDAVNRFSANIRTYPPGAKITLDVERSGKRMMIDAVIGRCPEESARARTVGFWPEYGKACARFGEWWNEYFVPVTQLSKHGED
jgi:C-terminal processing protease CtpA/Prc